MWNVAVVGRSHARVLGADVSRTFLTTGVWTLSLWFLYPIAWGLCEGGNVISSDSEAIFYGILDVLAKPVFGAILLFGHRNIAPARLGLHIRDYDALPSRATGTGAGIGGVHEKHHGVGHNGVGTTGTTAATGTTATTGTTGVTGTGHHHATDATTAV